MSDEWNKGDLSTGPQRGCEAQQGQFARQQQQRRRRDAAAQAAREREQRFQDQMIREAIRTASQPVLTGGGRIFRSPPSKGGNGAIYALGALVLLFVYFGTGNQDRMMPIRTVMPAQHRPPPAEGGPREEPAKGDSLNAPVASVTDRPTTGPSMPPIDRFALRRIDLVHGDNLELAVAWQAPDGVRRAAVMSAFVVTRDAARRRTPILEGWAVFPGESTIPLALPPGILSGKYELETVWTLGGEAREARTHFTLAERSVASNAGTSPSLQTLTTSPAVVSVATSMVPVMEPIPTPPTAQAPAPPVTPPAALGPPVARPRAPAIDQLYTGG